MSLWGDFSAVAGKESRKEMLGIFIGNGSNGEGIQPRWKVPHCRPQPLHMEVFTLQSSFLKLKVFNIRGKKRKSQ